MDEVTCPWCQGSMDKQTWVPLDSKVNGKLALVCFNCASKVHTKYLKETIEKDKEGYGQW